MKCDLHKILNLHKEQTGIRSDGFISRYSTAWCFAVFISFMFVTLVLLPSAVIERFQDTHTLKPSKPAPVFEAYPAVVREAARKELEKNLLGAALTDANVRVLNHKLLSVGLAVDNHSKVKILTKDEWEQAKADDEKLYDYTSRDRLENAIYGFKRLEKMNSPFLKELELHEVQSVPASEVKTDAPVIEDNVSVTEEEEEEIVQDNLEAFYQSTKNAQDSQVSLYQRRVLKRQKLLMRYLLTTMQNSLKVPAGSYGKVTAGSRYLQERLNYYGN